MSITSSQLNVKSHSDIIRISYKQEKVTYWFFSGNNNISMLKNMASEIKIIFQEEEKGGGGVEV